MAAMSMTRKALSAPLRAGLLLAAACGVAFADGGPAATQPAERPWGTSKAGVQVSLSVSGPVRAGEKLTARLAIRNVGGAAVALPAAKEVFGWLLLYYGRQDAYVTAKVFPAAGLGEGKWPDRLAAGKAIAFEPAELSALDVYSYAKRQQVYTAYLKPDGGAAMPKPDGRVASKLVPALAKARFMLYVPRPGETPLLLQSNVVDVEILEIAPPQWSGLSAEAQKAFAAGLIERFDRDAWSAQKAHGEAVQMGEGIVPYLIEAVRDRKRPSHSRLWLATALADIRCESSAAELIRLLDDPSGGVRSVVGYHGPKQRSAKLDAAIIDRISAEKNPGTVSYTLLGFLVHRKQVPEKLLAASFESTDPKVRATVAAALRGQASDFNVSRLTKLVGDEDERVRAAAAKALGAMNRGGEPVIAALVRALQAPGDYARKNIAEALGAITGKEMPYDGDASPAEKQKLVQAWKDWFARRQP